MCRDKLPQSIVSTLSETSNMPNGISLHPQPTLIFFSNYLKLSHSLCFAQRTFSEPLHKDSWKFVPIRVPICSWCLTHRQYYIGHICCMDEWMNRNCFHLLAQLHHHNPSWDLFTYCISLSPGPQNSWVSIRYYSTSYPFHCLCRLYWMLNHFPWLNWSIINELKYLVHSFSNYSIAW